MSDRSQLLSIGTFSMITRLTPRALRLYDERGLLRPDRKEITGFRYYHYRQISTAIQLQRLAGMGFGIQEMKQILEARADPEGGALMDQAFRQRIEEIDQEIERLERIRGALERHSPMEVMKMEPSEMIVKELPAQRVLTKRETGTYEQTIPKLISEACGLVFNPDNQQGGATINGAPMVLYYENEAKEQADMEVALPVSGKLVVDEAFQVRTLEPMSVLSTIHKGPFHEVAPVWQRLYEHLAQEGYEQTGPGREVYLSDPKEVDESELLTELQIPIRK